MESNKRLLSFYVLIIFLLNIFTEPLQCQWEKELIGAGSSGSIVLDSTGMPHMSYLNSHTYGNVVYSKKEGNQWLSTVLTASGDIDCVALALDNEGKPHIIYSEFDDATFTSDLKYIKLQEGEWTSPETITTTDYGFWSLSIKIDAADYIHITYLETSVPAGTGHIIYYNNLSGSWVSEMVNDRSQNPSTSDVSMDVDDNGYVHIVSYFPSMGGPAYVTNSPDGDWSNFILIQTNWYGGQLEKMFNDIALDRDGKPHISYVGSIDGEAVEDHRYAKIDPYGLFVSQRVDEGSWFSSGNAIACDPDGVVHIVYFHWESEEVRYTMNYSGSWPHETIATPGIDEIDYMTVVDIEVDTNGYAHVYYEDDNNVVYATNKVEIPAPNIVLSPPELHFGTIDTMKTLTMSLYIKNEGVLDLHISDIKISGGDSAEFSMDQMCDIIVPGDSCEVQVTFAPEIMGEKETGIVIASNDPDTPLITAIITGRTPYPVINVDPLEMEFYPLQLGESETLTLTLENTGDADLEIDSLKITGDDNNVFSFSSSCWTVSQSSTCDMEVTFDPDAAGTHEASLHIYSNDPENTEVTVSLKGRTPSARIEVEREIIDFGTVPAGQIGTAQLVLNNTGEYQLNISSVTITGTNAELFNSTSTCGVISSGGGSCTLRLTFFAESVGPKSAYLTINSNDPDNPAYSILLQGRGGEVQTMANAYVAEESVRFYCMDTLSTGDVVVGGRTGNNAYLAVLSTRGDILWQKELGFAEVPAFHIYTVNELWDRSIAVGGKYVAEGLNPEGYECRWIARIGEDGEIIWQKKSTEDYRGSIQDIKITSDSCLIAVGDIWNGPSAPDMWIAKFDSEGTLLWQKRIGGSGTDNKETGTSVIETDNGNFILIEANSLTKEAGYGSRALKKYPDGGYLAGIPRKILKFSSEGDIIWQKKMELSGNSLLVRIGPDGNILWQYSYVLPDRGLIINNVAITASGDIIALCSGWFSTEDVDMFVMRLSEAGDIIWAKQFAAPLIQEGFEIKMHKEEKIVIAGNYKSNPPIGDEALLCMISPEGYLDGCASDYFINAVVSKNQTYFSFEDITLPYSSGEAVFTDDDLAVSDGSVTAENICTGIPEDRDHDGVNDTGEAGPDGTDLLYDGNDDGLPDSQQSDVASLHTYDNSEYITMVAEKGTQLQDVAAKDNPSPDDMPGEFEFGLGFFDFTITGLDEGGEATLELLLPPGYEPETYFKYAATQDNPEAHWYEFLYDGSTGAEIEDNKITLHFIDGQRGDEDLTENGRVKDIGGPGMQGEPNGIIDIDDHLSAKALVIYPNPFSEYTNIRLELEYSRHVTIDLYDQLGNRISTIADQPMEVGTNTIRFIPQSLPAGVYFLQVEADGLRFTRKIIMH
ncbi:MAG: choice-of-anchor D domain-containing protein [Bacteroidota bacterium]